MKTIATIKTELTRHNDRSAWDKGVTMYALDMLSDMPDDAEMFGSPADKKTLLNGADNWTQYSDGGCALIYDGDIAERLCNPSELKKTRNGERNPNGHETWLDVQSRALFQASNRIMRIAKQD